MSDLLKLKRLVDGDDLFAWRVEAACWQVDQEYTDSVLKFVASRPSILAEASLTPPDTIDSAPVQDATISAAVNEYKETNNG